MNDNELSAAMREILGPKWCPISAGHPRDYCCAGKANPQCAALIIPYPAVAYALMESLGVFSINTIARTRAIPVWTSYAKHRNWREQGIGPTRAEAECRALVALWQRMQEGGE